MLNKELKIYSEEELLEVINDRKKDEENNFENYKSMNFGGRIPLENIDKEFAKIIEFSETLVKKDLSKDIELAKRIWKHPYFRKLTKTEASDEKLWVTMTHEYFRTYTFNRWIKGVEKPDIKVHLFVTGKHMYNRNAIARLWWIPKQTYSNNLDDPYLYTTQILSKSQYDQSIMESSLAKNAEALQKFMAALLKVTNEGKYSNDIIKPIIKKINKVGGTYILDMLDIADFEKIIREVIKELGK